MAAMQASSRTALPSVDRLLRSGLAVKIAERKLGWVKVLAGSWMLNWPIEEQIAFALKQAALGTKADEICRKIGISDATFYKWCQKYGGLGPSRPVPSHSV